MQSKSVIYIVNGHNLLCIRDIFLVAEISSVVFFLVIEVFCFGIKFRRGMVLVFESKKKKVNGMKSGKRRRRKRRKEREQVNSCAHVAERETKKEEERNSMKILNCRNWYSIYKEFI